MFVCCECRVLSGRGLCDELITRPEESYRPWCVVVCDLETSRMGAPYIYDISRLRVKYIFINVNRFPGNEKYGSMRTLCKNFLPKRITGFRETLSKLMYCPLYSRFSKKSEERGIIISNLNTFHIHELKEYLHLCSNPHGQNRL